MINIDIKNAQNSSMVACHFKAFV